jgi:hypothetical protein
MPQFREWYALRWKAAENELAARRSRVATRGHPETAIQLGAKYSE